MFTQAVALISKGERDLLGLSIGHHTQNVLKPLT